VIRARVDWLGIYVPIFIVLLYLPSLFVFIFSLNSGIHVAFPLKSLTFDWYSHMASNDALLAAARNSLRIGTISGLVATIFGVLAAFVLVRYHPPGSRPIATLAMLPLLIPGVILGISMLVMLRVLGFQNSLVAVAFGHVMFCTPLTLSIMSSRFVALDASIEEAALDLGANEWRTFMAITLPLCWSAMLSSFILAFVASFDEFIIAFFLAGTQITLPLYIWGQLRFPSRLPEILALGSCTLAFSFVCVLLAEWLRRRTLPLT
jgi:spermidine/putrescine transport system permease protein